MDVDDELFSRAAWVTASGPAKLCVCRLAGWLFGVSVATIVLFGPALAASKRDWQACAATDPASIEACTKALNDTKEPAKNRAKGFNVRGLSYFSRYEFDQAIADYSQAIALDPGLTAAYSNRASAYYDRGQYSGSQEDFNLAIADYSAAIRLNPAEASVYSERGSAYRTSGDNDKALADFNEAIYRDPTDENPYYSRGRTLSREQGIRSGHRRL